MRCRLAYDGELVSRVLAVFLRVISRWYRRQAQAMGYDRARCGSVTFVQAVRLFTESQSPPACTHARWGLRRWGRSSGFRSRPALSDPEVRRIVQTIAHRIIRLYTKRGLLDDPQPIGSPRRGARAGRSHGRLVAGDHRHRGTRRPAFATRPERCGRRGAYGAFVLRFARLFSACGDADRRLGPSARYAATWPARPWPPGACASSIRHTFPSRWAPVSPYGEMRPEWSQRDRVGPGTGPQATQPYGEPCQTTCKRSSASLPCPLRVFGALTRGPKRGLIFPILRDVAGRWHNPIRRLHEADMDETGGDVGWGACRAALWAVETARRPRRRLRIRQH